MAVSFTKAPLGSSASLDLCVIGNLTIDLILRGISELPQWGREVIGSDRSEVVAGQGGAMAFAASSLGLNVALVSDVGEDEAGERMKRELREAGVGIELVRTVTGGATQMTVALVRPDGERAFVSDLGRLGDSEDPTWSPQWPRASDTRAVALVGTSNLTSIDLADAARYFAQMRAAGSLTVFDPGWDPSGWSNETVREVMAVVAESDLFLPNLDEARALVGDARVEAIMSRLEEACPGVVVVKNGDQGSYVVDGVEVLVVEALAARVDNAVGAGDVFDTALVAGYVRGHDVVDAIKLATAAASLYVARRTDRFPSFDECLALTPRVKVHTL